MKSEWIMEAVCNSIHDKILDEWKHEGHVCGLSSEHINFEIDDKEYVLILKEVKEGEHWNGKVGDEE